LTISYPYEQEIAQADAPVNTLQVAYWLCCQLSFGRFHNRRADVCIAVFDPGLSTRL